MRSRTISTKSGNYNKRLHNYKSSLRGVQLRLRERQRTAKRSRNERGARVDIAENGDALPAETAFDEQIEVPLEECPDCGTALGVSGQRAIEQTILELPEVKPRVSRLRTYRNHC